MGVPTFYKWLSVRFPKVVKEAIEAKGNVVEGEVIPVDLSLPNPNDIEFDNLYLDMNGIIHPCTHPEDGADPCSEEEMFNNVFEDIDRIVAVVRPRKLLYMAIDGVAPRAKMNQQRTRRFKAAADAQLNENLYEELKGEFMQDGRTCPPMKTVWDSNVITPGTPFMDRLALSLRYYIRSKMSIDPYWSTLKVLLSDANNPGEGEHKIMQFIRSQRTTVGYDPNTKHCLHGADADLIMLGLATHEAHFFILREEVVLSSQVKCNLCGLMGHQMSDCPAIRGRIEDNTDATGHITTLEDVMIANANAGNSHKNSWKPLQFLQIPVLREYLSVEFQFKEKPLQFGFDLERCIDDFVMMCFFVGNDFLPNLPSLSIYKGSIDMMLVLYLKVLPSLGDYLTVEGRMNYKQVKKFLTYIGDVEEEVFRGDRRRDAAVARRKAEDEARSAFTDPTMGVGETPSETSSVKQRILDRMLQPSVPPPPPTQASVLSARAGVDPNVSAAAALRSTLLMPSPFVSTTAEKNCEINNPGGSVNAIQTKETKGTKESRGDTVCGILDDAEAFYKLLEERKKKLSEKKDVSDGIQLGVGQKDEWRWRYYTQKFGVKSIADCKMLSASIAREYVKGLSWVLAYYYQGVASWGWYYPFHYAPFASDLTTDGFSASANELTLSLGKPFRPFDQLMAVLPGHSSHALPAQFADLMTNSASPIADFYPTKFKQDPDGKRFVWQWVVVLPFIDERRLLRCLDPLEATLTDDEKRRNGCGGDIIFVSKHNALATAVMDGISSDNLTVKIEPTNADGIGGFISKDPNMIALGDKYKEQYLPNAPPIVSRVVSAIFCNPHKTHHKSSLLIGAELRRAELDEMETNEKVCDNMNERTYNAGRARRLILGSIGGLSVADSNMQEGVRHQQQLYSFGPHREHREHREREQRSSRPYEHRRGRGGRGEPRWG